MPTEGGPTAPPCGRCVRVREVTHQEGSPPEPRPSSARPGLCREGRVGVTGWHRASGQGAGSALCPQQGRGAMAPQSKPQTWARRQVKGKITPMKKLILSGCWGASGKG